MTKRVQSNGNMPNVWTNRRMFSSYDVSKDGLTQSVENRGGDMTTVKAVAKAVSAPTGKLKKKAN